VSADREQSGIGQFATRSGRASTDPALVGLDQIDLGQIDLGQIDLGQIDLELTDWLLAPTQLQRRDWRVPRSLPER
jgi:hypothetical protein